MRLAGFLWYRMGRWLDAKGLPEAAAACYAHAGTASGGYAVEALLTLGKRELQKLKFAEARGAFLEAVRLNPNDVRVWCGLGAAQRQSGEMDEARSSYEQALSLDPEYPAALTNLGEWWLARSHPTEALALFERVLARTPDFYEALANRVAALFEMDRVEEAEQAARAAIERYPESAPLHVNLGNVLVHTGRGRPALLAYRKALELQPGYEEAKYNLAILLHDWENLPDAIGFLSRQIAAKGETVTLLAMLATAQNAKHDFAAMDETCRKVLALHPNHVSVLALVAAAASSRGNPAKAVEYYGKMVALRPEMSSMYSNVLFESVYLADLSPQETFQRHREWSERYEIPLSATRYRHESGTDPERRLRIGYVSGDFCNHPVGALFRGIVSHHDRANFEIHCYSTFMTPDPMTEIIRGDADVWHDIALMGDAEIAEMIKADGIDILVDLSGHTAFNRLPVFARKPSPVQATWIGYFHSTGLDSIDYFISDPYTSPVGSGQFFSEIPVHLPYSRFCYTPPEYAPEPVGLPPCERNGFVTFGSFNRLPKLTEPVIRAWSAILARMPTAKLLIKTRGAEQEAVAKTLKERFAANGVAADRLILRAPSGHLDMLNEYGGMDVALDTFPFNGGLTTLEALWMGVPVVTMAGDAVVSRQSVSALVNIGHPELAFADINGYIEGAVALASDRDRLVALRRSLRADMASSPICKPAPFVRDLESLYRRMWRAWCEGGNLPSAIFPDGVANPPPTED